MNRIPPDKILERSDCELERTPKEFIAWIESKCGLFAANQEARKYALYREDLAKQFFEEMLRLSHICAHLYRTRDHIAVTPHLGNDNFDAVVTDHAVPGQINKYEFTRAVNGYDESARLRYCADHGYVSMTGPIKRTKASVEVDEGGADRNERIRNTLDLVRQAASKKAHKQYGVDTSLVIVFEDWPIFQDLEDRAKLGEFVRKEIVPMPLACKTLFLLGTSGHILLEFPVRSYSTNPG